jgi:hypothetical protein
MASQQPAYRAFTVVKREGQDDFWLPIGAAFAHEKGDGFNVILQAPPISGGDGTCKIVLRPPKDDKGGEIERDQRTWRPMIAAATHASIGDSSLNQDHHCRHSSPERRGFFCAYSHHILTPFPVHPHHRWISRPRFNHGRG